MGVRRLLGDVGKRHVLQDAQHVEEGFELIRVDEIVQKLVKLVGGGFDLWAECAAPVGEENPHTAAILGIGLAAQQIFLFHPIQERGHRGRMAADQQRQLGCAHAIIGIQRAQSVPFQDIQPQRIDQAIINLFQVTVSLFEVGCHATVKTQR